MTTTTSAQLEALLEPLIEALADRIVEKLAAGTRADMTDQAGSPLGRRRHIAACRERVARGEAGAAVVGRRHLLSRAALDAELTALAKRAPRKPGKRQQVDELAALREQYGVQRRDAA